MANAPVTTTDQEKEKEAVSQLYSGLTELSTVFGTNYHGTDIHVKLEAALSACRARWFELNPVDEIHEKAE